MVSICSGVVPIAAGGLLNDRRATTHWRYIDKLSLQYPTIDFQQDALYVIDENILTSAGSAAGLDMGLHIIREDYGSGIANDVARRLVLPTHREGGQKQYIPAPVAEAEGSLSPLLDKLREQLAEAHTNNSVAKLAGLSERTLIRRFKDATGKTPQLWLRDERLKRARLLLENSDLNCDLVAERCGFKSTETLRHHFRREVGIPPIGYRNLFKQANV